MVCSCQSFSIDLSKEGITNSMCCHTRLTEGILDLLKSQGDTLPLSRHKKVILSAMKLHNQPVIQLSSKSGVDRFSIVADGSSEFVTLFNVSKTNRNIVSCHSSVCRIAEGSTRQVKTLGKSEVLCAHLVVFREFYHQHIQQNLSDEEDGLYDEEDDNNTEIPATLPEEKVTVIT